MKRIVLTILSWLFGGLLGAWGLYIVLGTINLLLRDHSRDPLDVRVEPSWHHVTVAIVIGIPMLSAGILLLFGYFRQLTRIGPIFFFFGILIGGISTVIHLVSPDFQPRPLGFMAVNGFICALASAIGWSLASLQLGKSKSQSQGRRRRRHHTG